MPAPLRLTFYLADGNFPGGQLLRTPTPRRVLAEDEEQLRDLIAQTLSDWNSGYLPQESHIAFCELGTGSEPRRDGTVALVESLMIPFAVRPDGSVRVADLLARDLTAGELRRAVRAGYIAGRWDRLVLRPQEGMGGDTLAFDVLRWMSTLGIQPLAPLSSAPAVLLGWLIRHYWPLGRTRRRQREARRVAAQLRDSGLQYPTTLMRLIDTKTEWQARQLGRALRVHPRTARQLLQAAGWVHAADQRHWIKDQQLTGQQMRQRWQTIAEDPDMSYFNNS
ncbi:hypothetical protein [Amnibacterium endophyticum]|uniref:Uncharacterized protein n=1 Tax=Amnibacterium endophyticum TaxID=2109337 RepID=A0ABW4LHJ9_9MICO